MAEAKKVDDPKKLKIFAEKLIGHCEDETGVDFYEDSANSTKALVEAAITMMKKQYGLSCFQMGCILWDIIDRLVLDEHDVGLELVNYNNMLYPQYEYRFEKTISKECWEEMQKKAKELIENDKKDPYLSANNDVLEHWKKIVDGEVPFGYTVKEEKR